MTYEEIKENVIRSTAESIKEEDALGFAQYHIGKADEWRCPIAKDAIAFVDAVLETMMFDYDEDVDGLTEEEFHGILDRLDEESEDILRYAVDKLING